MKTPEGSVDDIFAPGGGLRLDLLEESAASAVRESIRLARETRWDSLRSPHIFMGLLAGAQPPVAPLPYTLTSLVLTDFGPGDLVVGNAKENIRNSSELTASEINRTQKAQ